MSSDIGSAVGGLLRRGWDTNAAQQEIVDDFAGRHDRAVLTVPTGHGLLVT